MSRRTESGSGCQGNESGSHCRCFLRYGDRQPRRRERYTGQGPDGGRRHEKQKNGSETAHIKKAVQGMDQILKLGNLNIKINFCLKKISNIKIIFVEKKFIIIVFSQ